MKWRAVPRTQVVLEYPLAVGISTWSAIMGLLALYGLTPSRTISQLPDGQAAAWGLGVIVASVTTLWGLLISRNVLTVCRGMFLHSITVTIYWISIIASSGWNNGGAVASFLMIIALVIAREGVILRRRALTGVRGAT